MQNEKNNNLLLEKQIKQVMRIQKNALLNMTDNNKNYSINEDYQKINLMVKKEILNKIKEKTKKEKTTIKKIIEEILTKNL